ncbi:hypothetical protein Poli38472_014477 [Pythium oligandrum]|uniref:PPM-type phosphatase domain-containing protein n=1 Tax=Pythium oligandrum TaxID=41045 RepID=A0A8K1CDR6_PYTOL|nr:hypothetical protein Poli38472_014477 [Pythium oligandrum]|eukprot:TMW61016.1 hypothetical protein Poli38472_014477 [Pythium oligandrum]
MGCIYTRICAEDEDEFMLVDDMEKSSMIASKTRAPPPRFSRTATTLINLEPLHGGKPGKRRLTGRGLAASDSVYYGGGIPGVALDEEALQSPEYTGAVIGGYTSSNGKLRWGAHTRAGNDPLRRRKENQDSFCVSDALADEKNVTFFSVFDGHGPEGAHISHFVREAYHQSLTATYKDVILQQRATQRASVGNDLMAETFQRAAQSVTEKLTATTMDISVSGTTAVGLLVCERDIFVANLGDSRAVVAEFDEEKGSYVVRHETKDHKPELPDERQRIEAHNGRVFEWGSYRVWLQDVDMPGLAMSRSFGDSVAKTVGVTSEPDVVYVDRVPFSNTEHPSFAVLASDGVWEFISTDECLALISECILSANMSPQEACNALIAEAYDRWNAEEDVVDDITAIVVYF